MKKEDLDLLIKEGEGFTVEFKEKYTSKIVQDIVAFANSKGGKILLGVGDNGKIKAEKLTGKMKAEIFTLARSCDPKIDIYIKQIEEVVVVSVDEGNDKPYSCAGSYYKRFDAVTQKLNRSETKAIFESNTTHYDAKKNLKASLDDISLKKIRSFYKAADIKYKVSEETLSNILKSLNLMEKDLVNNAALLFFAEKIDSFFLHSQVMLLAFKDYEGAVIFDRKEVRDDLFTQFTESEFFLKRHMSLQGVVEGMKRRNVYEIPEEAWREAIANAIIHRDYRMEGTSVQIRIFPDRVEVISPGRLSNGITAKNIGDLSSRRNEIIADMFARLDIVEKAGTGIVRIREAMKKENLPPPVFEDKGDFFKIILYRPKVAKESLYEEKKVPRKGTQKRYLEKVPRKGTQKRYPEKVQKKYTDKIGLTAQKVLGMIDENKFVTIAEIANEIGITAKAVKKHITNLKDKKFIKRIGPDNGGYWKICLSVDILTDLKGDDS